MAKKESAEKTERNTRRQTRKKYSTEDCSAPKICSSHNVR
jgi:hypothetical protein